MSFDLFSHSQIHRKKSTSPERFTLDDDMSRVERSFLADLLIEDIGDVITWRESPLRKKEIVERFRKCGDQGKVHQCPSCLVRFYSRFYCKHRLCDVCARIYGRQVYKRVMELIGPCLSNRKKGWTIAMLTLSESSGKYRNHYPDSDEYKRFNHNVGAFCRLFYGKYRGKFTRTGKVREDRKHYRGAGSIGVNEFGQGNNNLHSHILLYGPFIPWEKLQAAWVKITGGDTGCFIEPIRNPDKAAHYVAKYITKPPRFYDPTEAIDFVKATKGARRIRTGGIFYNQMKLEKLERDRDRCPFCCVFLHYEGLADLERVIFGFNLHHVRKNPDFYESGEIFSEIKSLPRGVTPIDFPEFPRLLPRGAVN